MGDLYCVRWAIITALVYVLVVLIFFAGHTVGMSERNAQEADRIVRSYPNRR